MKKLLIALSVLFLLSGCSCLIGQIPAQYIYSDSSGCTAILPDYRPLLPVRDNCKLASVIQIPAAGYVITADTMIVNVIIRATDASGNSSQRNFNVMLLDTIAPIFADNTLLTADYDKMEALYKQGDRILKSKVLNADALFPYAELGITVWPDSVFYMVREIRLKDNNPTVMMMWQK
jgi:hypothetical protein